VTSFRARFAHPLAESFAVRHLLAVVLAPVLFAVLASAAPVPKDAKKEPVCYYPTTVGSKWVYTAAGSDLVLVVSKVEERKGAKVVTVERVDGEKRRLDVVMEVSATGLAITEDGWVKRDPPSAVLKVPFKARDSWDFEHPGLDGVAAQKGTYVVGGVEKVKVPAGTFEAVRLDVDFTTVIGGRPRKSKVNEWYAPHVGLVKKTDENDETATRLLKSFTPGKE
jgi:hypothetical protein